MLQILISISALATITSSNTIHSILYLILTFINTSIYLITMGVEFIALFIIIIYVGAIAILFIFVLMLLNLKTEQNIPSQYLPIALIFGIFFLSLLSAPEIIMPSTYTTWINIISSSSVIPIATYIYNYQYVQLVLATLILLLAMVGVIKITLNKPINNKYQNVYEQNSALLKNNLYK